MMMLTRMLSWSTTTVDVHDVRGVVWSRSTTSTRRAIWS